MFTGEYNHTIDAKGRLIVPSKFREQLGEEFVVTKGLDGCLFVYSTEEWNRFEEKFSEVPLTTKDARKFSRFFFAGAAGFSCSTLILSNFVLRFAVSAASRSISSSSSSYNAL